MNTHSECHTVAEAVGALVDERSDEVNQLIRPTAVSGSGKVCKTFTVDSKTVEVCIEVRIKAGSGSP